MSRGLSKKREELFRELEVEVRRSNVLGSFFFRVIADRIGMNLIDLQVTNILDITGPVTAGRLAELTGVTTGAVTGILNRLEEAGLVRRERDPNDRRRVIVRLTPNEDVMREIGPIFESIGRAWTELVSDYDDRELAVVLEVMKKANKMTRGEIVKVRETPEKGDESGEFSAPLGSLESGRLVFASGASRVTVRSDPEMEDLYRARFKGPQPDIRVKDGTVTIRYPRRFRPFEWRKYAADVILNSSIPWEVEVRGGASNFTADLAGLDLGSFEIKGGASRIEASLPHPSGTVPVRLSGGASNIVLHRPADTAARMRVGGGVSKLAFDEQRFGAIGGEVRLQSHGYENSESRYDINVSGGASSLSVDTS